jgi:hypothetical protein
VEEAPETRYPTPRLRRAAARLLALELGAAPATAETLAAASGRLLDKLSQRLAQVIGPVGVHSILRRAVKLRKAEFPFLDERIVISDSRASLSELFRACLQEQEPAVIEDVSVTLFATFAGSLATLVGDKLTWSLLQQIWPDALSTSERTPGD